MYESNLRHVVFVLSSADGEKNRVNNVRNDMCLDCYIIAATDEKRKNSPPYYCLFQGNRTRKILWLILNYNYH